MNTKTKHPDYLWATAEDPGNPKHDRCICGGIRYWHAVHPYGCDDCGCNEFVREEDS